MGRVTRWSGGPWAAVRRAAVPLVLAVAALSLPSGATAADAEVVFDVPTAEAVLGEHVTFTTTFTASVPPERVELSSGLTTAQGEFVQLATVEPDGPARYRATVVREGHTPPNTSFRFRFRAVTAAGTIDGPEGTFTVVDERFAWQTISGGVVTVHWHAGGSDLGARALRIAEEAIDRASTLLGVTLDEPVDFFVYSDRDAFRAALGPGARENVGGEANPATRTMVGLIEPTAIDSDWVDVLVTHELTHLVFAEAVENPYHQPPRWLNEGLAVHLSEGYTAGDRATVEAAADDGSIIPLEGLSGFFPTTRDRFALAYAESVSAVDHFIGVHGEEKLVALIRSYATGVTDDEAFETATGGDVAAFDAAWLDSLGVAVPDALGPQPGPPGPAPPDWLAAPAGGLVVLLALHHRRRSGRPTPLVG
jgi:hypothetical protein